MGGVGLDGYPSWCLYLATISMIDESWVTSKGEMGGCEVSLHIVHAPVVALLPSSFLSVDGLEHLLLKSVTTI